MAQPMGCKSREGRESGKMCGRLMEEEGGNGLDLDREEAKGGQR